MIIQNLKTLNEKQAIKLISPIQDHFIMVGSKQIADLDSGASTVRQLTGCFS